MDSEQGLPVELYIYDLTHGLASLLSPAILGRQIEGVWHTSVVAYGREFFYGSHGISTCAPGSLQLGAPQQVERLGQTFVPFPVFAEYLQGLATTTYTGSEYRLLEHNCNHFSEEVAQFLCGAHVPKHIVRQPETVLSGPQRLALQALLDNLLPGPPGQAVFANGVRRSRQDSPDFLTLNSQIEEARVQSAELEQRRSSLAEKLARKERKKEKKRKKLMRDGHGDGAGEMAEAVEASLGEELVSRAGPSAGAAGLGAELEDERHQEEQRRRSRDPPIVYKDIDGAAEFEKFQKSLEGVELSAEDKQSVDELQQYLVQGEGSWVLGDDFLSFIGRVLSSFSAEAREAALRCLAAAALREDVSLLLHQDRRHHALLNYAQQIDALPAPQQRALALLMCNLFEHISSSEWLLYISEWEHLGQPLSNIRATTKVCVHATLSEDEELRELGTALMHNVTTKERFSVGKALRDLLPRKAKSKVFDEVCAELALALLQLLQGSPSEPHLHRALAALARLAAHSADVPQLIQLVGPAPDAFRGVSQRVDEQIDLIMKRLK
ncbi:uncharacterized protein LOC106136737 isoform X1 [Amyelois transitella]|uniref:uncharacterized protein LOC106136737 isoform X1 n=1 Tax=Amyelois transitella TaxID=680683 RepID=UPI0029905762|nr:uncharacterized protein LOC106136737 isoform X1 [Amyelois transitella]XP_013192827.2 uncharacterized protein LOC106136737 isoform X1 [Amyelois transitella]XP_013192828.2 uncharacterized protein LOC106136737 isoform X1 [Amyelois transitella]XP_013192829.2 uncharacterized protein LOC106136737 isoform X1 [Amyelois transitella]